jgi:signal peptidase I
MSEESIVPDSEEPKTEDGQKPRSFFSSVLAFVSEMVHVVLISLAIIIPVRYFLIQPFYVKGASMEPNFQDHEYLIIDEISYRFHEPQRGDIVVFRYPNDPRQYFIKRVVGLPGERVTVSGGKVTLYEAGQSEGRVLDESTYLREEVRTAGEKDVTLQADQYFLLGDNRAASLDSRIFGAVPRDFLIGKVWLRGWPPERAKVFTSQTDFTAEVATP